MCQNATKTAASLMLAIEPTIKSLLTLTGQASTPAGIAAINAYNAALAALQAWQSGTPAENVLELLNAFQAVFNTVPLPAVYQVLGNIVLAGIETVIGVLTANSPAPAAPAETADRANLLFAHDIQAAHQVNVAVDTAAKVQALVPGFKRSIWHSPESQYKTAWNKAVDSEGLDASLKAA
jgi:hypothetical protein